jgi:hypothetical protein
LGKAKVIDFFPVVQYIRSYFKNDAYFTFSGLTRLENDDFLIASARYEGGYNGKLLCFFQFTKDLEFVHVIEISLTDSVYGNLKGHFLMVDGVLNHIIRGVRRQFALDKNQKVELLRTDTIDASALEVNAWNQFNDSSHKIAGEMQAIALGDYIVYENFVLNKNTNVVESLLPDLVSSYCEPNLLADVNARDFVINKTQHYKATLTNGEISFATGNIPVIPKDTIETVNILGNALNKDNFIGAILCRRDGLTTGENKV